MTEALVFDSASELGTWLSESSEPIRLIENPNEDCEQHTAVHLNCNQLEAFSPGDLTCTVGSALERSVLDEHLGAEGLELSCDGEGSLAGIFARGEQRTGAAPRSQILGMEGLSTDGRAFRAGSRVVKSVAGYDLHKLFVGSRGRLFVATRLHLRLRPSPKRELEFCQPHCSQVDALRTFAQLRRSQAPWRFLRVHLQPEGGQVSGVVAGSAQAVELATRDHDLQAGPALPKPVKDSEPAMCSLRALALTSDLPRLLESLPFAFDLNYWSSGSLDLRVPTQALEEMNRRLINLELSATTKAPDGNCRPLGPGPNSVQQALEQRLRTVFDPQGRLR